MTTRDPSTASLPGDNRKTELAWGKEPQWRVVHVTTVPMTLGFLSGQRDIFARRGMTLAVVSSPGAELDAFAARERVTAVGVHMERRLSPVRDCVATVKLVAALRRLRPTLVAGHTPKAGLLSMVAATVALVPVRVYHLRGLRMQGVHGWRRKLLRATERLACGLADQVICVSHSLRETVLAEGICSPQKLRVFGAGSGQGVDATVRFNPARFSAEDRIAFRRSVGIDDTALVISYVGRVVRDKGVEELAAAWRQIEARYTRAHLLVVGPFESEDALSPEDTRLLRSHPRVHLLEWRSDTPEVYHASDVVVLPTYREGFPNVPLEAAAMERPVVATRVMGCVDAVEEGVTGTLVRVRDADDIAAALAKYLDSDDLRRAHGAAGRARVLRDFRREVLYEAAAAEYSRLISVAQDESSWPRRIRREPSEEPPAEP